MKNSRLLNMISLIMNLVSVITTTILYIVNFIYGLSAMFFLGIIQLIIFVILYINNYELKKSTHKSIYIWSVVTYLVLFFSSLSLSNTISISENNVIIFSAIVILLPMLISLYHLWINYKIFKAQ